jgi:hypothetical protein
MRILEKLKCREVTKYREEKLASFILFRNSSGIKHLEHTSGSFLDTSDTYIGSKDINHFISLKISRVAFLTLLTSTASTGFKM